MSDKLSPGQWLQTLPGILSAVAGVVTAVGGLLLVLNQIGLLGNDDPETPELPVVAEAPADAASRSGSGSGETGTVAAPLANEPESPLAAAFKDRRILYIGSRAGSEAPVIGQFGDAGAEVRRITPGELQEIGVLRPDLIIIGGDTGGDWMRLSPTVLRRLFASQKVIGLGGGGAELFQVLGANIGRGSVMHSPGNFTIEIAAFPEGLVPRPDIPGTVVAHAEVRGDAIGVYDRGSPTIQGFEAIARWPGSPNHWPVVRQGNLLLWGFGAPLTTLTADGEALFKSLSADHLLRQFVSYTEVRGEEEYVRPGVIAERLTPQFPGHSWKFRVTRAGPIVADLAWAANEGTLALILGGPGQVGYFARKDGRSPLQIEFEVTEELLASGKEWEISVTKFGGFSGGQIDYKLDLRFPE